MSEDGRTKTASKSPPKSKSASRSPPKSKSASRSPSGSPSKSRSPSPRSEKILKKPGPNDNPKRIWVGGLPDRVKEEDLQEIFGKFGELESVNIRSSRVDVFAFVEFKEREAATRATNEIDQSFIRGSRVKVHWAQFKGDERKNSSNQIWIGQLKENDEDALRKAFEKYGKIRSLKIRSNRTDVFAFIEYTTPEGCDDAIEGMNGKDCGGGEIRVAWAQDQSSKRGKSRSRDRGKRRSRSYDRRSPRRRSPKRGRSRSRDRGRGVPQGDFKLEIENIPDDMTWMDLKQLGREYGGRTTVTFARTWREGRKSMGLIEFNRKSAVEDTYDTLHGHRINGDKVYCRRVYH